MQGQRDIFEVTEEESDESDFALGETLFDADVEWEMQDLIPLFDREGKARLDVKPSAVRELTEEGRQINLALERWRKAHTPIKVNCHLGQQH